MYSLLPQGVEIKLMFALRKAMFEIQAAFQNFQICAWNFEFKERSQYCVCTPFLPQEIKIIFALRAAVLEIDQFKP